MRTKRPPTRPFVIRMPPDLHARLAAEAHRQGTTRSAVARQALAPLVRTLLRRRVPFLSDADLLALCQEHEVALTLPIPYSQLEAEAVQRGVSLRTVVRAYLRRKLEEVGVL